MLTFYDDSHQRFIQGGQGGACPPHGSVKEKFAPPHGKIPSPPGIKGKNDRKEEIKKKKERKRKKNGKDLQYFVKSV